jgi:hypothetical protein
MPHFLLSADTYGLAFVDANAKMVELEKNIRHPV